MDGKKLSLIGVGIFCIPIILALIGITALNFLTVYLQGIGMGLLVIGIAWIAYDSQKKKIPENK